MEITDPPVARKSTLTSIILAFLCFIAAVSLCQAESCYSFAQYECQKEMNGVVQAQQSPDPYRKYSCGNFTKLSKCIIHHIEVCIQKGEKNDSQTFIEDVVKHYTSHPFNCSKVSFWSSAKKGAAVSNIFKCTWTVPMVCAIWLTKYLYSYI
ncbi:uncharacterized protein LOC115211632 [Argonauta hians]